MPRTKHSSKRDGRPLKSQPVQCMALWSGQTRVVIGNAVVSSDRNSRQKQHATGQKTDRRVMGPVDTRTAGSRPRPPYSDAHSPASAAFNHQRTLFQTTVDSDWRPGLDVIFGLLLVDAIKQCFGSRAQGNELSRMMLNLADCTPARGRRAKQG